MNNPQGVKRRNVFIKKEFQTNFAFRFLVLIVIESVLAVGLFLYLSKGTVITGFYGSELVIERTGEYFLPWLLLANLVVIGLTAAAGFAVMLFSSHKIAGPLYRFEKSLETVSKGDLTYRFNLREGDQISELAESLNEFNSMMDSAVSGIKGGLGRLKALEAELKAAASAGDIKRVEKLLDEASGIISGLDRSVEYFRTSGPKT